MIWWLGCSDAFYFYGGKSLCSANTLITSSARQSTHLETSNAKAHRSSEPVWRNATVLITYTYTYFKLLYLQQQKWTCLFITGNTLSIWY